MSTRSIYSRPRAHTCELWNGRDWCQVVAYDTAQLERLMKLAWKDRHPQWHEALWPTVRVSLMCEEAATDRSDQKVLGEQGRLHSQAAPSQGVHKRPVTLDMASFQATVLEGPAGLDVLGLWFDFAEKPAWNLRREHSIFHLFSSAFAHIYFTTAVTAGGVSILMHNPDYAAGRVDLLTLELGSNVRTRRTYLTRSTPSVFKLRAGGAVLYFDIRSLGSGRPMQFTDLHLWQTRTSQNIENLQAAGWRFMGNCAVCILEERLVALRYADCGYQYAT
jgi:hypothetical protein